MARYLIVVAACAVVGYSIGVLSRGWPAWPGSLLTVVICVGLWVAIRPRTKGDH